MSGISLYDLFFVMLFLSLLPPPPFFFPCIISFLSHCEKFSLSARALSVVPGAFSPVSPIPSGNEEWAFHWRFHISVFYSLLFMSIYVCRATNVDIKKKRKRKKRECWCAQEKKQTRVAMCWLLATKNIGKLKGSMQGLRLTRCVRATSEIYELPCFTNGWKRRDGHCALPRLIVGRKHSPLSLDLHCYSQLNIGTGGRKHCWDRRTRQGACSQLGVSLAWHLRRHPLSFPSWRMPLKFPYRSSFSFLDFIQRRITTTYPKVFTSPLITGVIRWKTCAGRRSGVFRADYREL